VRFVAVDERLGVGPAAVYGLADPHQLFVAEDLAVALERLGPRFLAFFKFLAGPVQIERKSHLSAGFGDGRAVEHLFHPNIHSRHADLR
jgi:hypothetical protein